MQIITTSNYRANANLHTLQTTTAPTKPFPSLCLHQPFPGNGFNSGDFSASRAQILSSQPPVQNITLNWQLTNNWARVRVTLRLAVYCQSVRLGDKPLETHDQNIFFQMSTCGHSPNVTSSLTRGQICRLQLLMVLASAVILGSGSRGTHDHILLSQIWDSPTWRTRSPYLYPPGTGWPSYTPRHRVLFSSPPATRRAKMEVFEPASTGGILTTMLPSMKSNVTGSSQLSSI
jgi:hypothetical protein